MSEAFTTIKLKISEMDWFLINKVRELRKARNLSQTDLSDAMGLAEGVVGKIENPNNSAKYNIRHITLLTNALNCSPCEIMPGEPLKNDKIKVTLKMNKRGRRNIGDIKFEVLKIEPHKPLPEVS
jgi:transcriptional regulator with XRE-family HTH domain